jgi:DNA-binding transcriptional MerR regulator
MGDLLTIGEVAERTAVATSTLRYYDELGLLQPDARSSGHRRYRPEAVATVGVIRLLQEVGFTLAETKQLISSRATARTAWRELARRKADELRDRLAKEQAALVAIEHSLACPKDDILDCPNFWKTVGHVITGARLADLDEPRVRGASDS